MFKRIVGLLIMFAAVNAYSKEESPKEFYVYQDAGSRLNHYIPSGWMGSYGSLKFNPRWTVEPKEGTSCIQITYNVSKDSDTQWAGIYWQHVAQNWGDKKGGYDLSEYKRVTFWAKGQGYIDKFMIGGITGQTELGDSGEAYVERIDLTPEWKKYTIDLKGIDLGHIIGGFGFASSAEFNQKNVVLYLDEIRYEK